MQYRRTRSYRLADIEPNALVRVDYIVFGTLRDLCFGIGLREGDRFLCEAISPDSIVLADPDGKVISLDREWARFISVSDCDTIQASDPDRDEWAPQAVGSGYDAESSAHGRMMRTLERNRLEQELGGFTREDLDDTGIESLPTAIADRS